MSRIEQRFCVGEAISDENDSGSSCVTSWSLLDSIGQQLGADEWINQKIDG